MTKKEIDKLETIIAKAVDLRDSTGDDALKAVLTVVVTELAKAHPNHGE